MSVGTVGGARVRGRFMPSLTHYPHTAPKTPTDSTCHSTQFNIHLPKLTTCIVPIQILHSSFAVLANGLCRGKKCNSNVRVEYTCIEMM